jgi:hypothetical protein
MSSTRGNINYFPSDETSDVYYGPTITSSETGTFTLKIKSVPTNAFDLLASTGTGGTSIWDSVNKILTLSGTKEQINARIDYITMTQISDYSSNIILSYELTTPASVVVNKLQVLLPATVESTISYIHLMRRYQTNYANTLFATNVPQITDTAVTGDVYAITLTSTLGEFAVNETNIGTTWTYSGTRAEVNAIFNQIKFYPNEDSTASGTISYTQTKNGTTQVSRNFFLLNNSTPAVTALTFASTTTWTPAYEYKKYGVDILLVGGGGGGGYGGGGGAGVRTLSDYAIGAGPYSINIGAGGTAGTQWNGQGVADYTGGEGGTTNITTVSPYSVFGEVNGGKGGKDVNNYFDGVYKNISTGGQSGSYTGGPSIKSGGNQLGDNRESASGGGGGASINANGGNASLTSGSVPMIGGLGATGVASSITGTEVIYANGAQGGALYDRLGTTYNIKGSQPTTYGSGGAGAYGVRLGTTSTTPNAGIGGVVIVKIHV